MSTASTPPPTNPLVCPPLPPVRPCDVRIRDLRRPPEPIAQRIEAPTIRALLGIKAYAMCVGGPVAAEVAACVDDLIAGPSGLLFRRVNEWGWEFYAANVRPERIPITKLDKRWTWRKHFAAYAGGGRGIVGQLKKRERVERGQEQGGESVRAAGCDSQTLPVPRMEETRDAN